MRLLGYVKVWGCREGCCGMFSFLGKFCCGCVVFKRGFGLWIVM